MMLPGRKLIMYSASGDENLSEDIDQLFELTKIMVLVLSGLVPGLEESNSKGTQCSILPESLD